MCSHTHILVRVPRPFEVTDAELLERVQALYGPEAQETLRLRIRYFGDGLVLGSEAYVNGIFQEFRSHFGPKRRTGARKLRWLPFAELRTLRDLKKDVVS
jgi:hypothetical protein